MRGTIMRQVTFLTITPDQLIPPDHPIRRVKPLVDAALAELGPVFDVTLDCEDGAPIGGEITEINDSIVKEPGLVNSDPMGAGWFFKMRIADPAQIAVLLDEPGYRALVG